MISKCKNMEKNIAIIGLGYWGKNLLNAFSELGYISHCCTKTNKNKNWLKKYNPNIKHTTNIKDILNNKKIELVIIATPISTQYNLVSKCLENQKHVFVEKPLTENYKKAKKLFDLAKKKNLTLFVGYVFLYHPIIKKISKIIQGEKIKYVKFNWKKLGNFDEDIFLDLISHDISLSLKLFGNPSKIKLLQKIGFVTPKDKILLELEYTKKFKVIIEIDRVAENKEKTLQIILKNKELIWKDYSLYEIKNKIPKMRKIYSSNDTALNEESKAFMKAVSNKTSNNNTKIALKTLEILSKINKR